MINKKNFYFKSVFFLVLLFLFITSFENLYAADLKLYPQEDAIYYGCTHNLKIDINSQENLTGFHLFIKYDPSKIIILDGIPQEKGLQLKTGYAFDTYPVNTIDEKEGLIELEGKITTSPRNFKKDTTLATISFLTEDNPDKVNFKFDNLQFIILKDENNKEIKPNTTDSSLTLENGSCLKETLNQFDLERTQNNIERYLNEPNIFLKDTLDILDKPENTLENTSLNNTAIDDFVSKYGLLLAIAIFLLCIWLILQIISSFWSFLKLFKLPNFFSNLGNWILGIKIDFNKNPWGIILDKNNKQAIQYAVVTIFYSESNAVVDRKITDIRGRYSFYLDKGIYKVNVKSNGYQEVEKYIYVHNKNQKYTDIFKLNLLTTNQNIPPKVNLNTYFSLKYKIFFKNTWHYLKLLILFLCFVLSIINLIYSASLLSILIFSFFIVFATRYLIASFIKNKKAELIESNTNLRIAFAEIKFIDLKTGEIIDVQTTDKKGVFDYWGPSKTIGVLAKKTGYAFPSNIERNYSRITIEDTTILKIKLKTGRNKLKIYMDKLTNSPLNRTGNQTFNQ